jgi:hypothetical protein
MTARTGRSAFIRTAVPAWERIASIVIALLLCGIGVAIWWKGAHFDPSLYQPDPGKLIAAGETLDLPETAPGEMPASPVRSAPDDPIIAEYAAAETGGSRPSTAPSGSGDRAIQLPGFNPSAPPETYSSETLFEKINGRAPAYLEFGFRKLTCLTFPSGGGETDYVDLYLYQMGDPVGAFGIFALEQDASGKPLDFAGDGYASGTGLFFRQGTHYVQVIASSEAALETARSVAAATAKLLPADDAGLDKLKLLPQSGMVAGTLEHFEENAFGLAFLKNLSQARYRGDFGEVAFFIAAAPDALAAADMERGYIAFCTKHGEIRETTHISGRTVTVADVMGHPRLFYVEGAQFCGVQQAPSSDAAKAFIATILQPK